MRTDHRQVRLTSCVEAIIQIHGFLDESRLDPLLLRKFRQLETSLKSIELSHISEGDVQRVEDATNRLLQELSFIFSREEDDNSIHIGPLH